MINFNEFIIDGLNLFVVTLHEPGGRGRMRLHHVVIYWNMGCMFQTGYNMPTELSVANLSA